MVSYVPLEGYVPVVVACVFVMVSVSTWVRYHHVCVSVGALYLMNRSLSCEWEMSFHNFVSFRVFGDFCCDEGLFDWVVGP